MVLQSESPEGTGKDGVVDVNFVIHGRNLEIMLASVGAVGNEAFGNGPWRRCTREATHRMGIRWAKNVVKKAR